MLCELCTGNIYIVKSNHDEFVDRQARKKWKPSNDANYVCLAQAFLAAMGELDNGKPPMDPVRWLVEKYGNLKYPKRIVWLTRESSVLIGGVECGVHGDLGRNGSRSSLVGLSKSYVSCTVGHSHGAAIFNEVYRVGTSTDLRLPYTRGPTTWTQTHCLVYSNGNRQLISILDGHWRI